MVKIRWNVIFLAPGLTWQGSLISWTEGSFWNSNKDGAGCSCFRFRSCFLQNQNNCLMKAHLHASKSASMIWLAQKKMNPVGTSLCAEIGFSPVGSLFWKVIYLSWCWEHFGYFWAWNELHEEYKYQLESGKLWEVLLLLCIAFKIQV